jgi:DnaJ-class molecular chaperone
MPEEQKKAERPGRICPACHGTGLDKTAHRRYTTGGHDDRSCSRCQGECYIYDEETKAPPNDDRTA